MDVLGRNPYYLKIGSSETLPCSLKNDSHIRWYIHGKVASTSGRQIKISGDTLTINDITVSDGGTYECRGLKYTKFFTIYVIGRWLFHYKMVFLVVSVNSASVIVSNYYLSSSLNDPKLRNGGIAENQLKF